LHRNNYKRQRGAFKKLKEKKILMLLYLSHKHIEIVNIHILMLIYTVEIIDSKHTTHNKYYDAQTKERGQCSCISVINTTHSTGHHTYNQNIIIST